MMQQPARENGGTVRDPRNDPGFRPDLYPSANGVAAPPPDSNVGNDRLVLEFLAAYYEINRRHVAHREALSAAASGAGPDQERTLLQAVETALRRRDDLEDRYAPYGVVAEPAMRQGIAVDVTFTFGNVNAAGKPRSRPVVSSAVLAIPLPPGVRREARAGRDGAPPAFPPV